MNCPVCRTVLAPALAEMGLDIHPKCADEFEQELQVRNDQLKSQLLEIIRWADDNSERSKQVAIGPSEVGLECDQRVARILAGMPQVNNRFDPWAGIVGTSIHSWLQQAVDRWLEQHVIPEGEPPWFTEMRVTAVEFLSGSSDLYNGDVIDYKSAASEKIKKMREKGPEMVPTHYRVQGHIYGLGQENAGRKVRDVVLVFVPRNGLIKDMYLWREPYDENVALRAIDRIYRLVDELTHNGLPGVAPENWGIVERNPSGDCWYCPFYKPELEFPDATGCPGESKTLEEKQAKADERFNKGIF